MLKLWRCRSSGLQQKGGHTFRHLTAFGNSSGDGILKGASNAAYRRIIFLNGISGESANFGLFN
jgi:hypothetical protein